MKVSSDPEHIIQLVLQGHTVQKPLRLSNAVSLTLLFDSSQKFIQVDTQFHAISRDLQRGLEKLLGHKVCKAMGYGDLHLPLTTLANGIIERKAENFNFAAFAMHPATPDPVREVPPPLARPYGCRQGLYTSWELHICRTVARLRNLFRPTASPPGETMCRMSKTSAHTFRYLNHGLNSSPCLPLLA